MPSLLVVAPQIEEVEGLLDGFRRHGVDAEPVSVGALSCTVLPALDLLVAVGGNGKAQFGIQCQYLIDRCPGTSLLVCAGAGGSLTDAVAIGDVVVATATIEHDYLERFTPIPLPRHDADPVVLRELAQTVDASGLRFPVHFGPIASGDEDIVSAARASEVRRLTSALCAAWEGCGGARAAAFNGIGFLEIRAITDRADFDAARSFHGNVGRVLGHVAELLLAWHARRRAAS